MKKIKCYKMRVDSDDVYKGYIAEIENTVEAMQEFCYGYIECIKITNELVAIINEEGKIRDMPVNRILVRADEKILDMLAGNILVVRADGEEFVSIEESDIEVIEKRLLPFCGLMANKIVIYSPEHLAEWKGEP